MAKKWPVNYILEDKIPIPVPNLGALMEWYDQHDKECIVASVTRGEREIITRFICIDLNLGDGPPLIFETRIVTPNRTKLIEMYSTWEQAETGHNRTIERSIQEGYDVLNI